MQLTQHKKHAFVFLDPFAKHVRKTRSRFIASLEQLPPSTRSRIQAHVHRRLSQRARRPRPLIGEYAPWLAADLLGIQDVRLVRETAIAWLNVYFFTLILDDAIDNNPKDAHSDYIASCLLLQRGLTHLHLLSKNRRRLGLNIDCAFSRTAEATIQELLNHRNKISDYGSNDVATLGNKIGLLGVCTSAVSELAPISRMKLKHAEVAFAKLATAIQLLDDLTDWQEDLDTGNLTFPLTFTLERATGSHSKQNLFRSARRNAHDKILLSMVQTGAIEETLTFAIEALKKAAASIRAVGRTGDGVLTHRYVDALISNCQYARTAIARYRLNLRDRSDSRNTLRNNANVLAAIRRTLQVVAQKS